MTLPLLSQNDNEQKLQLFFSQELPQGPPSVLILHMEFSDDALVDEDGDGDAEESNEGEVAAGPPKVELEVLTAGVPVLDELVLVHFHPSSHFSPIRSKILMLRGDPIDERERARALERKSLAALS